MDYLQKENITSTFLLVEHRKQKLRSDQCLTSVIISIQFHVSNCSGVSDCITPCWFRYYHRILSAQLHSFFIIVPMFSSLPSHASHLMASFRYSHSCICNISLHFFHWHQITCHEHVITLIFYCKFLLCGFNQNGIIILTCSPIIFNHLNSHLPLHLGVRIMWIIIPCFRPLCYSLPMLQ